MVASLNPVKDTQQLMLEFEDALADVMGAKAALCDVNQDLASVKAQLEVSRAELLTEGVEGKNTEQREANLRLALHDLYQELFLCEAEVARKRLHVDLESKKWDLLRYRLRGLEAMSRFESKANKGSVRMSRLNCLAYKASKR